jgi:PTS system galactitol-specific IIC component
MEAILDVLGNVVSGLGAGGIMFLVILVLGLIFTRNFGSSLRAGLLVGVGLAGLLLVVNEFVAQITPVTEGLVSRFNVQKEIIDIGWTTYAIAVGSLVYVTSIPINLVVNTVMLALGWTRTINVDIHNMWHGAAVGAFVWAITDNYIYAIIASVVYMIALVKISDFVTPTISGYYNMEGLCWTTASTTETAVLALPFLWLLNKIPGLENVKVDPESIRKRFGFMGEPSVIGFILGVLLAIAAGYGFVKTVIFGIWVAALLVLLPMLVRPIIQGLTVVTEAVREQLSARFTEGVWIAVDTAVLVGHPTVVATALLLTPITVLLSIALPWIRMIPVASLVAIPWAVAGIVAYAKGDIVRSLITGTLVMVILLSIATYLAPTVTAAMPLAGLEVPEGAQAVSGIDHVAFPMTPIFTFIFSLLP